LVTKPEVGATIEDWRIQSLQNLQKNQRRTKAAVIMYTFSNIWKERNQRTFEAKEAQPTSALQLIKEEGRAVPRMYLSLV